jgi:hypothetical protein
MKPRKRQMHNIQSHSSVAWSLLLRPRPSSVYFHLLCVLNVAPKILRLYVENTHLIATILGILSRIYFEIQEFTSQTTLRCPCTLVTCFHALRIGYEISSFMINICVIEVIIIAINLTQQCLFSMSTLTWGNIIHVASIIIIINLMSYILYFLM